MRRRFEKQGKKETQRDQAPSAIRYADEIATSPAPQDPTQAWESPASTFYSGSSPTSGIGSDSTAVSSPEITSEAQMQQKGDRKNSWSKQLTRVFKKKVKDDIPSQQPQTPVATLPKIAEQNVDHRYLAQHQAGQA